MFYVLLLLLAMDLPKIEGPPSHRYGHCNMCPHNKSPACWHNQRPTIPSVGWFGQKLKQAVKVVKEKVIPKLKNLKDKAKEKVKPKTTTPKTSTQPPPTRRWKGAYSPFELWIICPKPEYDDEPVFFKYCLDGGCEVGCREERTKYVSSFNWFAFELLVDSCLNCWLNLACCLGKCALAA